MPKSEFFSILPLDKCQNSLWIKYTMFIRECTSYSRSAKKYYTYRKLVENYRTAKGSRQRVIFNLGTLEIEKKQWKELASGIENRLPGLENLLITENSDIKKLADRYTEQILKKQKISAAKKNIFQKDDLENIHVDSIDGIPNRCQNY